MTPLSRPPASQSDIRRVAILFAGGPAPAANAVISTAAVSFLRNGIEVVGILNGYTHLVGYSESNPLQEGRDYVMIDQRLLRRTRNSRGILLGTARTNPGRGVTKKSDLSDPAKTAPLRTVRNALASLGINALISIGGDDTLKTANKFRQFQEHLPDDDPSKRIAVVHVPKTIDNDYLGIDFTFGYFTAVDTIAGEILNLLADAESCRTYFIAETMGRSAGWLAYGAAIAGEASLVVSVEDVIGKYRTTEVYADPETGEPCTRPVMVLKEVVRRIVATMLVREQERKEFGVIILAEGIAEYLPADQLKGIGRDDHGHIAIAQVNMARLFARLVADEYTRVTGKSRRVHGLQLGYEARCAPPHAFDVMLGSQLGVGAYRALVEEKRDGVMISVSGQLNLNYIPFETLIDQETLVTVVRYIQADSDFHKLARFLETYIQD
jgi:6-phosphofructokinase 1